MSEWQEILRRLAAIELGITDLVSRQDEEAERQGEQTADRRKQRRWYGTAKFAAIVERAEFTVREWCRNKRIHATKRKTGCGAAFEWVISGEELDRYRKEGLLPPDGSRQR